MIVTHNFKPIYNESSKILIIGTMPSVKSREKNFYYAHPQNRFWKILENIFNITLNNESDKITFLLNNHIALWDLYKSVDIKGSSDASIKNYEINDFTKILKESDIKAIFCTGKKSYNDSCKHLKLDIPIIYLPSPSPANAKTSLEELTNEYQIIKNYLS